MGISTNTGFSLNGPVIYPNSKKQQQVQSPNQADEATEVSRQVSSQTDKSASSATTNTAASTQSNQRTAQSKATTEQSRPMGSDDIVAQLAKIGQPITGASQHLASQMTQYGVPLSAENFQAVLRQLKGQSGQATVEAAVVSLLKGFTGLGRSVDILAPFFSGDLSLNQQQLVTALANFQSALSSGGSVFESGFLSQLSGIISQLQDDLKKYRENTQADTQGLTRSLLSLSQLLNGLEQQWLSKSGDKANAFYNRLLNLKKSSYDFIDRQLAPAILSSHEDSHAGDQFFYWVIPNALSPDQKIDVLIRKENGEINPKKTRIIVKLETPELGEVSIIIDTIDGLVWYTINADLAATKAALLAQRDALAERLSALNFTLRDMRFSDKPVDIKALLLPQSNLDDVIRIEVEA